MLLRRTGRITPRMMGEEGFIIVALIALTLYYADVLMGGWYDTLIVVAVLGTIPVFAGAAQNLLRREWASMDMLASVALGFSLWNAEWASAVFIALMLSAARLLTLLTESRTEKSIESLLRLRPDIAKVEHDGRVENIPTKRLVVGDTVIVDSGDRVPIDGTVIAGAAALDESSLTGESLPVDKTVGSPVFSSTLVASGSLRIAAEKVGKDTTLEKIVELVKLSRAHRSKITTMGERFGKLYLVLIFIIAGVLFLVTRDTALVLAIVLVVCADDVAIAVPLAFLGAIGSSAKEGVVVKGSAYLEALARARIFVFDKTGTLTKGALVVSGVYPVKNCSEQEVLRYATIVSSMSKHPFSRAIVTYAKEQGIEEEFPQMSHSEIGNGILATYNGSSITIGKLAFMESQGIPIPEEVRATVANLGNEGKSVTLIAHQGTILGSIALQDEIKREARETLQKLRSLGATRLVMLTGDGDNVARSVAAELGITEYHAGLLPEDKVTRIKELLRAGEVVMVGDGVNDAAALSTATVGIAMGAIGYDTAIESAHIVFMTDDLSKLPATIALGRRVGRIAVEDFWIWGLSNVLGLGLVFLGVIGVAGAAAYNFLSDFVPLGNSLRTWVPDSSQRTKRSILR